MNRRELLITTGATAAALGFTPFPFGWTPAREKKKQRVLMYTKSEGYEHDVVKRMDGKLSLAERTAQDLGRRHGIEIVCEKDGRIFQSDTLKDYDGFLFQSQGDVSKEKSVDNQPPMPPEGKMVLLRAIEDGKGFAGCHCASDTFHSAGHAQHRWENQEEVDPFLKMVGGEFAGHGKQQRAWMRVADPNFPGVKGTGEFGVVEEWYSLKNFAPDLHVILIQETRSMPQGDFDYKRPDFPATWARVHGKGRVFYTSMGHRADVWTSPLFHHILLGGLAWTLGNVEADITPNIDKVTPQARELPREEKK
jgi:type 1 glutamine amidotransferase